MIQAIPVFSAPGQIKSGDYIYIIENEKAVIIGYEGDDSDLVIPNELDGHPVIEINISNGVYTSDIQSIVIPYGVENIGNGAFENFGGLISVTIPNSAIKIGKQAFSGYRSLSTITILESVKTIDYGAFSFCDNLTTANVFSQVLGRTMFATMSY